MGELHITLITYYWSEINHLATPSCKGAWEIDSWWPSSTTEKRTLGSLVISKTENTTLHYCLTLVIPAPPWITSFLLHVIVLLMFEKLHYIVTTIGNLNIFKISSLFHPKNFAYV